MGIWDDIRSGKFGAYAPWLGRLSSILLIIFGWLTISLFSPLILFWSIVSFFMAAFLIMLEFPFCRWCCRAGKTTEKLLNVFEKHSFRTFLYLGFAAIMWTSAAIQASWLIFSAVMLTLTGSCYGIALLRKEQKNEGNGRSYANTAGRV